MLKQQEAVNERNDHAVVTLECDVPVGWSLEEWRAVRGLAREVTQVRAAPMWRRLLTARRRPRS
jgi:hypothetical protein